MLNRKAVMVMNSLYNEKNAAVLREIKISQYRVMDEIIGISHLINERKRRRYYNSYEEDHDEKAQADVIMGIKEA